MARTARVGSALVAAVAVVILLALLLLGFFDEHLTRIRLRLDSDAYRAAAIKVVERSSAGAEEGAIVFDPVDDQTRRLVDSTCLFYLRYSGDDFVYFDLHDDGTMSNGLIYSASGVAPPKQDELDWEQISPNWYYTEVNNGILEYGQVRP